MPDTLTFAFTDIVDSTAKCLAIGDAAYVAIAAQHDALIRSVAAPAELKTIGDSFMLCFSDPAEAVAKPAVAVPHTYGDAKSAVRHAAPVAHIPAAVCV